MKSDFAEKIMLIGKDRSSVTYRAACVCASDSPEQDCTVVIEYDKEEGRLYANFYKTVGVHEHARYPETFFEKIHRLWRRTKKTFVLLLTGYIDMEESFCLHGYQLDNIIKALQEGREYCLNYAEEVKRGKHTDSRDFTYHD